MPRSNRHLTRLASLDSHNCAGMDTIINQLRESVAERERTGRGGAGLKTAIITGKGGPQKMMNRILATMEGCSLIAGLFFSATISSLGAPPASVMLLEDDDWQKILYFYLFSIGECHLLYSICITMQFAKKVSTIFLKSNCRCREAPVVRRVSRTSHSHFFFLPAQRHCRQSLRNVLLQYVNIPTGAMHLHLLQDLV